LAARLAAAPPALAANDRAPETVAPTRPCVTGRADTGTTTRAILLESDGGSGLLGHWMLLVDGQMEGRVVRRIAL